MLSGPIRATPLVAAALLLIAGPAAAQAPNNDDVAGARTLPLAPFADIVDLGQATGDPSDPFFEGALPTVWYKVRPFVDLPLSLDLSLSDSEMVAVVFADPPGVDTVMGGGPQIDALPLEGQQTYWIMVFPAFEDTPDEARPIGVTVLASSLGFEAPPPLNDALAKATRIETLPFVEVADLARATAGPEDPEPDQYTVWYSITPAEDLALHCRLAAPSGLLALVAFTDPPSRETAVQFGAADPAAAFRMTLAAGVTYRLMLTSDTATQAILAINAAQPVRNDLRDRATVIDALPFGEIRDVTTATVSFDDAFGEAEEPAPTVWYRFTPRESMWVSLDAWQHGASERLVRVIPAGASGPLTDLFDTGDDADRVRLEAGVTYEFMVALYGEPAPLIFTARRVSTAPNDERSSPTLITALPFVDWSSSFATEAVVTGNPSDPLVRGEAATRWYRYAPTEDVVVSLAPTDLAAIDAVIFVFDSDWGEANPWAIGPALDGLTLEGGRSYEIMLAYNDAEEPLGLLVAERPADISAAGTLSITGMTTDLMSLFGRGLLGCAAACPGDGSFHFSDDDDFDLGAEPTLILPELRADIWELGWARLSSYDVDGIYNMRLLFQNRLVNIASGQTTLLDLGEVTAPSTVRVVLGPVAPYEGDFFYNAVVAIDAPEGATNFTIGAVMTVGPMVLPDAYLGELGGVVEGDIAPMQPWVGPAPTHIPLHVAVPAGVPMVLGFRYFYSMRVIEGDASALLLNGFYASNQAPPARAHAYGMMRTTSQEREANTIERLAPGQTVEVTLDIERPAVAAFTLYPPAPPAPLFFSTWRGTNASVARTAESAIGLRYAFALQPDGSPYPPDLRVEMPAGTWFGDLSIEEVVFNAEGLPETVGSHQAVVDVELGAGDVVEQTPGAPFTWNLSPGPGEFCHHSVDFSGTVTDADGVVEVLVNGVPASISPDDSFVARVPLVLGDNVVTIEARDANDEWVTRTRTLRYTITDTDGDGLSDCRERELAAAHDCLAIDQRDSDDDDLDDGAEIARGANPCAADTDGDGCNDAIDPTPTEADAVECLALVAGFRADVHNEPAGVHCQDGGRRVTFGQDDDRDGQLSTEEIESSVYVCDAGAPTLIEVTPFGPDSDCAAGGHWLDIGADFDADGAIDRPQELLSNLRVCNSDDGLTALVATRVLSAGTTCAAGGIELRHGLDDNRNGVLDPSEVDQVRALCDGEDGLDGRDALVIVTPEPQGAACATGGQRIDVGLDTDRDGVLDADEIDATSRVCNGLTGAAGAAGQDGALALVTLSAEAAGDRCAEGGQRLDAGLDVDGDAVLDAEEVVSSAWVCHGVDAVDGHTTLIAMSELAPGAECPAGGLRLDGGVDDDRDGALAPGEIDDSRVLCGGLDGLTALVSITDEAPGERCPVGGQKVQAGLDDDRDGALDADEVDQTSYVCNGAAGVPGEEGEHGTPGEDGTRGEDGAQALVALADVAPGEGCPGGGVAIRSGVDADRDGALGLDETTDTRVVCHGATPAAKDDGCHGGGAHWAPLGVLMIGLGLRRKGAASAKAAAREVPGYLAGRPTTAVTGSGWR